MAGLAAARRVGMAGGSCTIFEKSRGLGGRMATRRAGDLQFDHGAQYFTARGAAFRALVAEWRTTGVAALWGNDSSFVGTPGMTAPTRALAAGHTIVRDTLVTSLTRDSDGWTVTTQAADGAASGTGRFEAVILAIPAPQAVPLAAMAGVTFPEVERVRYAPCWALMLAFDQPIGGLADRVTFEDGPIRWIATDSSKPGRNSDKTTFVIHASPDWSRRNLERTADDAASDLTRHLMSLTGVFADPVHVSAHRWRYAQVEEAAGIDCQWNADARLGACGDWAIGPRVEAAFDSGEAMAAAILSTMDVAHGV